MGQPGAKYDTQLDLLFIDNEEIFGDMVIISSLGGSQLQTVVILRTVRKDSSRPWILGEQISAYSET